MNLSVLIGMLATVALILGLSLRLRAQTLRGNGGILTNVLL